MLDDEMLKDLREYREKNFEVKCDLVGKHSLFENEVNLRITHNGYQWFSMSIAQHEIPGVIYALKMAMERTDAI